MDKEKYIEDLKEIKDIMNRTTRFISLSGLSGVSTGIIALAGTFLAYQTIFKDQGYLVYNAVELNSDNLRYLLLIAVGTLILSIGTAIFFTSRKTKKQNQNGWNSQTKELLLNLLIPLITGGLLCLTLLFKGFVGILPPLTLIFYGLALLNGSKYTLSEIKNLGLIEILLGLTAFQFIDYGLLFWAFGFGVVQILYGIIIQIKYKS
jgi:hypothetical protein